MVYLDLDELPELLSRGPLTSRRFALSSFLERDHLANSTGPLRQSVVDFVEDRTGHRHLGRIRMLTQLRCFGYYFSPLNLYYCFDESGNRVEFVVAEVSNTPWQERHRYLLQVNRSDEAGKQLRYRHRKSFHVSPFMDLDADYVWRLSEPRDRLTVNVANSRDGGRPFFAAQLVMKRLPLTRWNLTRFAVRYPLMTVQIVVGIYYQALRLWMKKCPVYSHPNKHNGTTKFPA